MTKDVVIDTETMDKEPSALSLAVLLLYQGAK